MKLPGYHYNYGGHHKDMRESGSLAAVRKFHKSFYHAKNCCLIVCGDFEPEEIFSVGENLKFARMFRSFRVCNFFANSSKKIFLKKWTQFWLNLLMKFCNVFFSGYHILYGE